MMTVRRRLWAAVAGGVRPALHRACMTRPHAFRELCAEAVAAAVQRDVDRVPGLLEAAEATAGPRDPERVARAAAELWAQRWPHSVAGARAALRTVFGPSVVELCAPLEAAVEVLWARTPEVLVSPGSEMRAQFARFAGAATPTWGAAGAAWVLPAMLWEYASDDVSLTEGCAVVPCAHLGAAQLAVAARLVADGTDPAAAVSAAALIA